MRNKLVLFISLIAIVFSANSFSNSGRLLVVTYEVVEVTLENGKKIKVQTDSNVTKDDQEHSAISNAQFSIYKLPIDSNKNRLASKIRYRDKLTKISKNKWAIIINNSEISSDKHQSIFKEIIFTLNSEDEKNKSNFDELNIFGWKVRVQEDLQKDYPLKRRALASIRQQLQKITVKLPYEAQDQLRNVPILVYKNKQYSSKDAIAYYDNRYRAVVFHDVAKLNSLSNTKNAVVLHELTHGYHDIILGFDYQPIIEAYNNALEKGLYKNVKTYNGYVAPKAYALTNHVEYFAEATESYFASPAEKFGNDYYPFNRFELKNYDRKGYELLTKIWKR